MGAGAESHLALPAALWQRRLGEEKQRHKQGPALPGSPGDVGGKEPGRGSCSLTMC